MSSLEPSVSFFEDVTGLMSLKRNLVMLGSGLMVPLHFLEPLIGSIGVDILVSTPGSHRLLPHHCLCR